MNDFADWLSPIVVKELRQGLRARAFLAIFLISQFFMIVCVLVSLGDGPSKEGSFWLFRVLLGIAVLLAMPLRGLGALFGEIRGNTLELMLLTQLSAWRIVAGKWLALVLQTLLLICAVLPYVVLRYFLGGVSLIDDLSVLGWMVAGSILLTALSVGLSPSMQSPGARIATGFAAISQLWLIPFLLEGAGGSRPTFPAASAWLYATLLLGPLLILSFLQLGSGKIAPAAENHDTRKRLIAVAIILMAGILGHALRERGFFSALATMAVAPACLGALMEETVTIPSVYRPFVRRKLFGKLAGRVFYPGWASGLWFFALLAAVFLWGASTDWSNDAVHFRIFAALEGILAPLLLARFCFRRAKSVPPFYFGTQLLLFVTAIIFSANFDEKLLGKTLWIPTVGFFVSLWHRWGVVTPSNISFELLIVPALIALASFAGLFILSIKEWRTVAAMERDTEKLE